MKKLLTAAFIALIAVLPAYAQVSGGSIAGTVTDEQKAVLPGVTVTIQGSDRTQYRRDGRNRQVPVPESAARFLHRDASSWRASPTSSTKASSWPSAAIGLCRCS